MDYCHNSKSLNVRNCRQRFKSELFIFQYQHRIEPVKRLILYLFAVTFLTSCDDENTPEIETGEDYVWQEFQGLLSTGKYILNSTVAEDHLSFLAPELLITIDSNHQIAPQILGLTWDMRSLKPAMNNGFYLSLNEGNPTTLENGTFQLGYFNLWGSGLNYLTLSILKYDSTYSWIADKKITWSQEYGAFGDNEFLIDYRSEEYPDQVNYLLVSYVFKPGQLALGEPNFELTDVELFQFDAPGSFGNSGAFYCDGIFFVSIDNLGLYILQEDEFVRCQNIDFTSTIFFHNDAYYAVSNQTLLVSPDGFAWNDLAVFNMSLDHSNFTIIEDQVIVASNDQLFQVNFDADSLAIMEIENRGVAIILPPSKSITIVFTVPPCQDFFILNWNVFLLTKRNDLGSNPVSVV